MIQSTQDDLAQEVVALRRRVAELEGAETGRQVALAALEASREHLRSVVENSPIIVWAVDARGIIVLNEGAGLRSLGVRSGENVGRSVYELYRDVPQVAESVRRALAGEEFNEVAVLGDAVLSGWTAPIRGVDGSVIGAHGVATDITEQARAEERWQSLVRNSPEYICTCDRQQRVTFLNRIAPEYEPMTTADTIGHEYSSFAAPEHQEHVRDTIRSVFDTGRPASCEAQWLSPNGELRWFENHIGPLARDGQVHEVIITGVDVTERKQGEQELRALKDAFQSIAETLPGIVSVRNARTGEYSFVNEATQKIFGYPPETILERGFEFVKLLVHPDDLATMQDGCESRPLAEGGKERTARVGPLFDVEYRLRHSDGSWRWVRTSGTVFDRLPDGTVHHVLSITQDITDLRVAQEGLLQAQADLERRVQVRTAQLEEQNKLLESILEGMSDGVLVVDRDARLKVFNRTSREVMGLHEGHEAISDWRSLKGNMRPDGVTPYELSERPLLRALRRETVRNDELLFVRQDGRRSWLTVNAGPLFDDRGKLHGAVAVFRDDSQRRQAEMALRESLQRFDLMVVGSGVGMWDCVVNADDMFNPNTPIYYSSRLKELLGFSDDEFPAVLGSWASLVHPDDAPRVFQALEDHLLRRVPYETEQRVFTKSGELRWFQARGQAIWDEQGRPVRMSGSFSDITARKHAEEQLAESERRLQSILNGTPSIVYMKDLNGRYTFANDAYRRVFGGLQSPIVGQFDTDIFPPEVAKVFRENDLEILAGDSPVHLEENAWQNGELRTYLSVKCPLIGADGRPYALCGISTDIHDRKQAENNLRAEQNFLRRMLDAHERDRQLIAYDLHDGLVQDIAAAGMYFNSIDRSLTSLNESERQTYTQAMKMLKTAISDGRRVLSGLRPPILDEAGIVMALEYLAVEQAVPGELEIEVTADVHFKRLEPLLEGNIYRIVQESLTNVKRHSRSKRAEVLMMQVGERLTLVIQDWGIGFDPTLVPEAHFGLEGIRKRAALLGGQAEIDSAPGKGTRIAIEFPIRAPS